MKWAIILVVSVFCLVTVLAYVAPDPENVVVVFRSSYTAPDPEGIVIVFNQQNQVQVQQNNTCTYPGSGDWNINCADNCSVTSATNLGNNNLNIVGGGSISIEASVYNINNLEIHGRNGNDQCAVRCSTPGCFS